MDHSALIQVANFLVSDAPGKLLTNLRSHECKDETSYGSRLLAVMLALALPARRRLPQPVGLPSCRIRAMREYHAMTK